MTTKAEARAYLVEGVDDFLNSQVVPDLNTIDLTVTDGELGDGSFQELHIALAKYMCVDVNDGPSIRGETYDKLKVLYGKTLMAIHGLNTAWDLAETLEKHTPEWSEVMDRATGYDLDVSNLQEQMKLELGHTFLPFWDWDTKAYRI